ncbi:MAG: alpha-galactosidase [Ilumatobacteraceae bacterium]|nr:alpha-galactosidase [Ilumatobacteraceae bacterium]
MNALHRLTAAHLDLIVDTSSTPTIRYFGAPLGEVDTTSVIRALERPLVPGGLDVEPPLAIVPEAGGGFFGRPGLLGHRPTGIDHAPQFTVAGVERSDNSLRVDCVDDVAALRLAITISLDEALIASVSVHNDGPTRYHLDALTVTLPLPDHVDQLLLFDGRWAREFATRRVDWGEGTHQIDNRRGRTSHEHPPLLFAGQRGFGEWRGDVWGAHLAWSGNHSIRAERLADGRRYVQLGELLQPGEVVLESGESYRTPDVIAVHGYGLTPASWGFHRTVRRRGPQRVTPRAVVANTWEAMYFDHDPDAVRALADAAAAVGVERFVLDDGWFGGRRGDTAGLGDWVVSEDVYPDGLAPLIDHVRGLGMEFGIWVEPEMVNTDSELYRAHPDWVLVDQRRAPVLGRNQLVLDITRDDAFAHVLGQLDALLVDHDIAYVKWDMNRPLVAPATSGAPGTRRHTLALYRLFDELRERHPNVEFESCAGGGGRIDLEILRRTERVWASDCIDPLERQAIQRGLSMLLPPEVVGAHIGAPRAHTTQRTSRTSFRTATALFGHLGVECDIGAQTPGEQARIAEAIALYRRFRPLIHAGDVVRFDTEDSVMAHGAYAADRGEALVSFAQLTRSQQQVPARWLLPGLPFDARYTIRRIDLPGEVLGMAFSQPAWWAAGEPLVLTGRQLALHGLQPPVLHPETAVLVHLDRVV